MARRLLAILAALAVLATAPAARSAPMYTDFPTLRAKATLVVLGTVRTTVGPNNTSVITVDVDHVIRGSARLGPMVVKESPDGHVFLNNERVVAFIDSGALRWVGQLAAGASLETGVIRLAGFFDFNAHIVQPGIVTLAQLRSALATGVLDQSFDATLAFRDGHGGFARSSRTLGVEYAPFTRALHVTGATFACLQASALSGFDWGSFELHFYDTCPSAAANAPSRELTLEGKYTGVDARTGHIQVELVPTRPFLTEAQFATYVADGKIADMTSALDVALSDGTHWTWRLDKDMLDPGGNTHSAGGSSTSMTMKNGKSSEREEYEFGGDVKIALEQSSAAGSSGGNPRGLVTLVDSGAPLSCTFEQHHHPDRTCKLSTRAPIVVRR